MKKGWEIKKFTDCIQKVKNTKKIPRKKFLNEGMFPIVSQEKELINGYWDNSDDVFIVEKPVVIFGDHTKTIKYVDFDFAKGADGIKILLPKNDLNSKFFTYQLHNIKIPDLGYARHYRLLKENEIVIPPLPEQKQIVEILDQAFEAIDKVKANIEKNIVNANELFQSKREDYFSKLSEELDLIPIDKVCKNIFAGGDKPTNNFSKTQTKELNIPIVANAVKDNGLYGYTNKAKVTEPSITVAARGSGTGHTEYRDYPFVPIVRLIVLTPNTEIVEVEFLMYAIKNLTIARSGSAIPQLTVPMIKSYSIPTPSKEKQIEIIENLNQLEFELNQYKETLRKKIIELEELKKSILEKAFSGELTAL